ncbi:serine/arginine repetitive matrix protein 2 [Rhodotorula toruloides]|uniref:Serine/arginine repetitive matrix protein 2 n=1 Tax=Rhodotorula toruloides TaxID=5286 RepID=A0A511KF61_RHOTO|nr:serine/arginine repetitive matrix protein 2 [Rhodotorula toruloides]
MSSGSITISYTTLAEIALLVALVGGVAYIGSKPAANSPHPTASSLAQPGKKKSVAKKKKAGSVTQQVQDAAQPAVDKASEVVHAASTAVEHQVNNRPPAVQKAVEAVQDTVAQATGAAKKKGKKGKATGSKGGPSASTSGANSSSETSAPKTDAEKHAAATRGALSNAHPAADMRDDSHDPQPHVARVMKVVGGKAGADPKSLLKVPGQNEDGWERPDAFDDDDGEWEAVTSKKPSRPSTPSSAPLSAAPARSIPGLPSQPLTKKQRENAAKKTKEQAAKEAKETEQEERLRQYRKEQEKARLAADSLTRQRARPRSQNFFGSEPQPAPSKVVGGGMNASLDPSSGSLVWD